MDLPEHGNDLVGGVGAGQEVAEGGPGGGGQTENGLEAGAALGQPLSWIILWEEDRGWNAISCWLKSESDRHQ